MTDIAIWQPTGEVAEYQPSGPLDDWIRVADQVVRLAEVICRTPFVPDGLRGNAPATAAAILTGRELNIPPMTALANIHVIHGKPGLSALVMRALVLSQGHEWQDVDVSNTRVVLRGRRAGSTEWTTASFSAADAQTAKLPLSGYPQDKLYARASARLARRAFADVIAGMPYSVEELEDGIVPDEAEPAADRPAAAETKPRTAQRKQPRTQSPPPAPAASPVASADSTPPSSAGAGGDLPPLPGEEEGAPGPDPASVMAGPGAPDESPLSRDDAPGSVTSSQLTAIWTVLSQVYHYGADEKAEARAVCAQILNTELSTSTMLSKRQAGTVLDTLAHWQQQAEKQGDDPRGYLMVMLQSRTGEWVPDGE